MALDISGYQEQRERFLQALIKSDSNKKLVIAGPGTGKTFTFRRILEEVQGGGLVLTFINNLVDDLKEKLEPLAYVSTFHGFCRRLLHVTETPGISSHFHYYPGLSYLVAEDIVVVHGSGCNTASVDRAFHTLDNDLDIITLALKSGDYYDSVSHNDAVYRVLRYFENNPDEIPTYSVVLVDEYQDFNLLEARFIDLLSTRNPILVAGDDDQALYAFKHATADYLRALAQDPEFDKFELPFCSRCTDVIVSAVTHFVRKAQENGLLSQRLNKSFICYLPTKGQDSEEYPRIIYGDCTVQMKAAPYMCKYVQHKIHQIPTEDISESRAQGYPTVLVAGPRYFTRPLYELIREEYSNVEFRERPSNQSTIVEGYLELANDEQCRLGWRILLHEDSPANLPAILRSALDEGKELSEIVPREYRQRHLLNVDILRRWKNGEHVSRDEKRLLAQSCGATIGQTEVLISLQEDEGVLLEDEPVVDEDTVDEPRIVITTLVGAKGLDAGHVFIVGLNEGHLPGNNSNPTDEEACSFLVGLTRTRKCCYVVSCKRFGAEWQKPSVFLHWIRPFLETEVVNKTYFQRAE